MDIKGEGSVVRVGSTGVEHSDEVTQLLERWRDHVQASEEALLRATYPVLRAMSQATLSSFQMPAAPDATEIANEAYLRIRNQRDFHWRNREHFYAIAARVVRRLVIDEVREKSAQKRGSGLEFVPIELAREVIDTEVPSTPSEVQFDQLLGELARQDPRAAQLVELRFLAGLTIEEAAATMGCSQATATRTWRFARAWLANHIESSSA